MCLASVMADSEANTVTIEDSDIIDGVVASLGSLPVKAVTFEDIKREVSRDQEMQDLVGAIGSKEGQDRFSDTVSQYNKYSEDLSVLDGVPMYGRRVVVPASLSTVKEIRL